MKCDFPAWWRSRCRRGWYSRTNIWRVLRRKVSIYIYRGALRQTSRNEKVLGSVVKRFIESAGLSVCSPAGSLHLRSLPATSGNPRYSWNPREKFYLDSACSALGRLLISTVSVDRWICSAIKLHPSSLSAGVFEWQSLESGLAFQPPNDRPTALCSVAHRPSGCLRKFKLQFTLLHFAQYRGTINTDITNNWHAFFFPARAWFYFIRWVNSDRPGINWKYEHSVWLKRTWNPWLG